VGAAADLEEGTRVALNECWVVVEAAAAACERVKMKSERERAAALHAWACVRLSLSHSVFRNAFNPLFSLGVFLHTRV
jgi:hypothetical protein